VGVACDGILGVRAIVHEMNERATWSRMATHLVHPVNERATSVVRQDRIPFTR
jgi:hypothetical protein